MALAKKLKQTKTLDSPMPIVREEHMPATANVPSGPEESWGLLIRNVFILLAIIGSFSYGAFLVAAPFGWLARPESRLAVFLVGASCGELAALGVLVRLLRRRLSLSDLGWRKPTTWQAMVLGLTVAVAYTAVTALNPVVGPNLLGVSGLKALALGAALVAGVVEEVIFRGYVMTALARMGQSAFVQVMFSAALFAAAHIYGFTTPAAWLASEGFTFALGLALGIVYLVGRRSLTPVIVGHVMIDALIEPWLLLGLFKGGH